MRYNPNIHNRKSIRLKEYNYALPGEYFITICTNDKECLFGEIVEEDMKLSQIGAIVQRYWEEIPKHFPNVGLDAFIVMPNHIHGIIVITNSVGAIHELPLQGKLPLPMTKQQRRAMLLPKIIGRFKMNSAKEINMFRNTTGSHVWQRNYYDRIIRDEKELNNIREYIINNPLQWFFDEENPANNI